MIAFSECGVVGSTCLLVALSAWYVVCMLVIGIILVSSVMVGAMSFSDVYGVYLVCESCSCFGDRVGSW